MFLAVADIAACLPFLKAILLKNLPKSESFKFPTALAEFLKSYIQSITTSWYTNLFFFHFI